MTTMRSALQHGGQAVGDDQRGAALHQLVQRLLHQPFAFGVERAGGLVEQQDGGVAQHGPGDGDALALAAGEPHAALAEEGVEAFGQALEEFVGVGGLGGGAHLGVGGVRAAVADVVPARAGEEHRLLRRPGRSARARLRDRPRADRRRRARRAPACGS